MKPTKRKPQSYSKNEWETLNGTNSKLGIEDFEDIEQHVHEFQFTFIGLTSMEAIELLHKYGRNELSQKQTPKWLIFLSLFLEPMPVMIWIAIIIEAILGKWMDMGILIAIQITNASIAFYETTKSGDAVAALKASLKPLATVKRDGEWKHIDAALLVPGDLISLSSGSAIPADCRINDGTVEVDQAQLTGESLPVTKFKSDPCQMGSTVVRGEVEATVEFTGPRTFFGRTASLLQVN
jgi:H+-transporting ATPase